jgi:hypothetical protein
MVNCACADAGTAPLSLWSLLDQDQHKSQLQHTRTQCNPHHSFFACRDALRYIALREDYKSARVDGKPLVALFSGEGLESHMAAAGGRR